MLGVQKMGKEAQRFDAVRLIFDRYTEESLKSGARTGRIGGETVRYKITDDTVIEHLTTKQFLSDIKTNQDLTKYLSMKLYDVFQNVGFAVSYEFTCISNISDIEEADTCVMLHSLDVAKRYPFTDPVVYCCDTDVILLLLYYFDELCSSTIFFYYKLWHSPSEIKESSKSRAVHVTPWLLCTNWVRPNK